MALPSKRNIGIFLFLCPAVLVFIVYFIFPIGFLLYTSMMKWDGIGQMTYTGFSNYVKLTDDPIFIKSVNNTLIWGAASIFIHIPLAILVAMILSRKVAGWRFFRTFFIIPNLISTVAVSMMWLFIYNGEFGLLNALLEGVGLSSWQRNWLGEMNSAYPAMIAHWIFYIGIFMLIFIAQISTIDRSLYESSQIDGAGPISQDWLITLPLLKPSIIVAILLAITNTLKNFEAPFVMTGGGPVYQTMVLSVHIYKQTLNFVYGYANTLSIMLILMGAVFIVVVRLIFKEEKE
jgi:raffinose/stachyose/melibiose transport system permease protein